MTLFGLWGFRIVVVICGLLILTGTHIYSVSEFCQYGYYSLQFLKKPASSLASSGPFLPVIVVSPHVKFVPFHHDFAPFLTLVVTIFGVKHSVVWVCFVLEYVLIYLVEDHCARQISQ